ncbi:hypothetical protein MPTK1_1g15500 [Marchantia polymorpha subsp. ruderalis]|uniref:SOSS complex subunit A homolog n=2 Tax=Marchantia polymorpha TaxID=3197 RepID=A0AAF6AQH2_MARPO|nr:hypothetical protein MARPO_0033s0111 [Marchantia polymorpha]BBM98692.1 hypothetical protein Mp_1g15500 [Marchantia polymorpha subsp. ruderalis]|eukprot:PTQ41715.1 hypothetical protein MARPO_0033s0111 [Marchantia polymorpha]
MTGSVMASSLRLMLRGVNEAPDELEELLVRSYLSVQGQLTPPYHLSTVSPAQHAQLTQALLFGILQNPSAAPSHVTHLTAFTTDGYASFVSILLRMVNDSYGKLLEQSRTQMLWLLKKLITLSASDVDNLCLSLLRQVAGGDVSAGNVWLAAELLQIMKGNWSWFSGIPALFTTALYTYLRLLPDHTVAKGPNISDLKVNETAFCIQILRERFQDCLVIGRDLVRLLQDVALFPEFEPIWRDLLNNPGAAFKAPAFADIAQLYVVRTPTRYLASRVTPEMENQLRFMLTHVKMGSQRRYQTWFAQRFLSTPESETLVPDLIRFICCVHHPTNQILQSDIVPRWAIVGWLLKCCKSNHVESNAKLALFYDWLFFMSKTDNIMNIEPAILLMVYSIPKYVDMTHALLEFLFLLIEHYDPVRKDLIQKGVTSSIDILVNKRVVPSLDGLSASPFVASWLKDKLNFYFAPYCKTDPTDGYKMTRGDHFHQESSYDSVQQQMIGPSSKGSPGSPSRDLYGGGGSSDQTLTGQNQSLDITEDTKPGETDTTNRKRRRLGVSESLHLEVQLNFERLTEALKRSQEAAISALEKLFSLFLSAPDQIFGDRVLKDSSLTRSASSGDLSSAGAGNAGGDPASTTIAKFASQITEVLKKGGYELFGPLPKLPSDRPDGDETSSLTSSLLRFYVANCRSQPLLRQLLYCWHKEGLAVGARLLCYVSRLAEEIEPTATRSRLAKSPGGGQDFDILVSSKTEDDTYDAGMNGDGDEEGEFTESSGESVREPRKNGLTGSTTKIHGNSNSAARKGSRSRDLQMGGDIDGRLRVGVSDAFKTYEEFLKLTSKGTSTTVQTENNGAGPQHQGLQNCTVEGSVKVESGDVEADNMDVELLSDLELCLLWNTKRFLRVLPSVFRYLPNLAVGKDSILQLLVSTIDPQDLCSFEFKLVLGEFAILGDHQEVLLRCIKNSLKWEFIEQQFFWRLLVAELQGASPAVILQVLKICSSTLNPQSNSEAMSGLLLLLRYHLPTSQLVNAVLFLPPAFGKFAAVVISSWMSSHHSQLLACLQTLNNSSVKERPKKGGEEGEDVSNGVRRFSSSAVVVLLNAMDDADYIRNNADEKSARQTRAAEIRRALLKLAGAHGFAGMNTIQGTTDSAIENHQDRKMTS